MPRAFRPDALVAALAADLDRRSAAPWRALVVLVRAATRRTSRIEDNTNEPSEKAAASGGVLLIEKAQREKLTIRQLYKAIAGARGHKQLVGTPESIADELEEWFENDGADGFNIMPPHLPGGLTDFIQWVLPELRRRGLFRTEYEGRTLRENLGLRHRANRFFSEGAPGRVAAS
jgi:N-acetyl-S-(2-succino)cysteine monooxygenase